MTVVYESKFKVITSDDGVYVCEHNTGEVQVVLVEEDVNNKYRTILFDNFSISPLCVRGPRKLRIKEKTILDELKKACENIYRSSEKPLGDTDFKTFLASFFGEEKTEEIVNKVNQYIYL